MGLVLYSKRSEAFRTLYQRQLRATGVLWESRLRDSPIRKAYLRSCNRHVGLNPVRAFSVVPASVRDQLTLG
jgi:hypothetical protein